MKGYSYTSTPPMGRTACTEPQCLYSTRVHFFTLHIWWVITSSSAGERAIMVVKGNPMRATYTNLDLIILLTIEK
jgi:hypothetical protein